MPWPPPALPPQAEDVLDLAGALADLARAARETRTTLWSALQVGLPLNCPFSLLSHPLSVDIASYFQIRY